MYLTSERLISVRDREIAFPDTKSDLALKIAKKSIQKIAVI